MKLAQTIDSYALFYSRCIEFQSELTALSTTDYVDEKDKKPRQLLCYYADLLMIHADELKELGIAVELHESFEHYAKLWRENPTLSEVA